MSLGQRGSLTTYPELSPSVFSVAVHPPVLLTLGLRCPHASRSGPTVQKGNYQKALDTYKDIHRKFPENVEYAAASLQNLSLARISYDPARYPKYLPEAYCLCRGCLTGPFGEEDFRFRSTPVFVPAVVLRRTPACAGGRSVYTEEYVTVPVGCTCVPEQEKEADSVNSSMDKPGSKLLLSPSDKPGRP
ncbi:interleukin-17D [Camelus ferus]|nr:interleukin-17D [Camelus ferus]